MTDPCPACGGSPDGYGEPITCPYCTDADEDADGVEMFPAGSPIRGAD